MSRWASYDDARDVLEVEDDDWCPDCLGEGFYHDCGEDTCCCAYPDEDDACSECNGSGRLGGES